MAVKLTDAVLQTVPNGKLLLEEGKRRYLYYCEARNLRPRTIEGYSQGIERFITYFKNIHPNMKYCGNIDRKDVEYFTVHLKNEVGMTSSSVNSYLRHVRAWLYYLMDEEHAVMKFKVKLMRAERRIKDTYTDTELRILTNRPMMTNITFSEYRNWVIANFLLATGVRASTLINIRVMDVDFANNFITLDYTKSGKSYRIPMDAELKIILDEYLKITDASMDEPLFMTEDRQPLKYEGLKSAMTRYNERRGVEKNGLHIWRHTFAKLSVMNGMDVFTLQKMLGHEDLTTSRNYVEMFSEDLQQNFASFSPLSNLRRTPTTKDFNSRNRKIDMNKLRQL